MLAALIKLLVAIVTHVRVIDDIGDEIVKMLAPFAMKQEGGQIRQALMAYNVDAVWLIERASGRFNGDLDGHE